MINSQKFDLIEEIESAADCACNWFDLTLKQKNNIIIDKLGTDVFTGKYISDSNKIMTIKIENNLLFIIPEGQMPIEILKQSDNKFYSTQVNIELEFILDDIGNISSLDINQNGQVLSFKKGK